MVIKLKYLITGLTSIRGNSQDMMLLSISSSTVILGSIREYWLIRLDSPIKYSTVITVERALQSGREARPFEQLLTTFRIGLSQFVQRILSNQFYSSWL